MKIRTITYGVTRPWETSTAAEEEIKKAATLLRAATDQLETAGYEVQTTRLSLPSFLRGLTSTERETWLARLGPVCAEERLEFVSLGAYPARALSTAEIVNILAAYPSFNLTTKIAEDSRVSGEGVRQAGEAIRALSHATPDGLCNFRYAAIANCPPGIPFFPASYQSFSLNGHPTLALGLQMPDLVHQVIMEASAEIREYGPAALTPRLAAALAERLLPLQSLASGFCGTQVLHYNGIDLSPAPMGEESIVAAFEAAGLGRFGEPGTLALAAAITTGLQSIDALKTTGYSGLMLPPLEDRLLGERIEQGLVDVSKLLSYSAVCGTGLDVVPLPGETSELQLENLLYDVAALSSRYNKPLSARLFLVPGKQAGERTTFDSIYMTNTVVMSL